MFLIQAGIFAEPENGKSAGKRGVGDAELLRVERARGCKGQRCDQTEDQFWLMALHLGNAPGSERLTVDHDRCDTVKARRKRQMRVGA